MDELRSIWKYYGIMRRNLTNEASTTSFTKATN